MLTIAVYVIPSNLWPSNTGTIAGFLVFWFFKHAVTFAEVKVV